MAFVAEFGTRIFNLKTKFDMENKSSTSQENGNDANRLLPAVIFDEIIKSDEYKRYCKVYKVYEPTNEKEVGMYLIWKSFGSSI